MLQTDSHWSSRRACQDKATFKIFSTVTDEALRQQIDMAELVLERRAALRSNGERIREVVRLKELQHHFISYRSKV